MQYSKFVSAQLKEYHKIIYTLESSENPIHFEVVQNMLLNFGKLIKQRKRLLYKNAWYNLIKFKFNGFSEYNSYKQSATMQMQYLIKYCDSWSKQYEMWENERIKEEEQKKDMKKPKITIMGFSKLFKRKRK